MQNPNQFQVQFYTFFWTSSILYLVGQFNTCEVKHIKYHLACTHKQTNKLQSKIEKQQQNNITMFMFLCFILPSVSTSAFNALSANNLSSIISNLDSATYYQVKALNIIREKWRECVLMFDHSRVFAAPIGNNNAAPTKLNHYSTSSFKLSFLRLPISEGTGS